MSSRLPIRGISLCLSLLLAACAQEKHGFEGTWVDPTDGSRRLVIDAKEGIFTNSATGRSKTMRYLSKSPTELDFSNEQGKVSVVCTLSDDGESLQVVWHTPSGTQMSAFDRVEPQ